MDLGRGLRRILGSLLILVGLWAALFGGIFTICVGIFLVEPLKKGDWQSVRFTMDELLPCLAATVAGIAMAWLGFRLNAIEPSRRREGEG